MSEYVTLAGTVYDLDLLDDEERAVVAKLVRLQESVKKWTDYANAYMGIVSSLYMPQGLSRRQIVATAVWKIAQDLNSRLMEREMVRK